MIELILFKSGNVGIRSPKSDVNRCHALSQRTWGRAERCWICPGAIIGEVADAFPDGTQSPAFRRRLAEIKDMSGKATHIASDFDLPDFGHGKKMMPFQRAGLEFIEATGGNCLISDSMGLGKTVQTLAYLQLHPEMRPVVIVCPASLKLNWEREARSWLETEDRIEVISGGKVHELDSDIVVINYDILKKWTQALQSINPQILILDESHAVKSQKRSKKMPDGTTRRVDVGRSKAAKDLASITPHKILLTGTPILNRPSELWNQLQIIDPAQYTDKRFFQWHKRYANAYKSRFGWDFSGASNLEELAQSLKSIMIRRTKKQVLAELPDKRRQTILIPIDNRREYDTAESDFLTWIAEQKGADAADRVSHVEELAKIEVLRQIAVRGKTKQAIDWIKNFLSTGEKLVVFATHRETINALMTAFGEGTVKIDGGVSSEKRQAAVDAFQNDPETRLFVGNIKAAGVGITLTAASDVVFLELDWTPALMEQAEDRLHRISQKNAVNCYYLLAEKTVDASIAAMLERKRDVIDRITEDENTLSFELFEMVRGEQDEQRRV